MASKKFCFGMLAMVLVFGMVFSGCDNGTTSGDGGGGGGSKAKTLSISMPAEIFAYGAGGFSIGVFPVGTTAEQALAKTGIVAGLDDSSPGWYQSGADPVKLTAPLYNVSNGSAWTGSGVYDVYAILYGGGGHFYKISSLLISSADTPMGISVANEVSLGGGGGGLPDSGPKTLVASIPASIAAYASEGFSVAVVYAGTTLEQVITDPSLVIAGCSPLSPGMKFEGTDPVKATLPLYKLIEIEEDVYDLDDDSPWTGSGIYDIYAILSGGGIHYYCKESVTISSPDTYLEISDDDEVFPEP